MSTKATGNSEQQGKNEHTSSKTGLLRTLISKARKNKNTQEKNENQDLNPNSNVYNIIIADDKRVDKEAIRANWISGISLLIAIIAIVLTYIGFTETKKEFEKQNDSYLQLGDFELMQFEEKKPVIFKLTINDLGQPAKITEAYVRLISAPKNVGLDTIQKIQDFYKDHLHVAAKVLPQFMYLVNGNPHTYKVPFTDSIPASELAILQEGKFSLYLIGGYRYTNLVTEKKKEYKFLVEYNIGDSTYIFRDADNKEVPKE